MSSSSAAAASPTSTVLSAYAFTCFSEVDATACNPVITSLGGVVLPLSSSAPFANHICNDAGEGG
jgi:hypothetical protein